MGGAGGVGVIGAVELGWWCVGLRGGCGGGWAVRFGGAGEEVAEDGGGGAAAFGGVGAGARDFFEDGECRGEEAGEGVGRQAVGCEEGGHGCTVPEPYEIARGVFGIL